MTQVTRIAAAEAIAEIINQDDDHGARVWTKEDSVRLYLKFNTNAKKGWIDNGFIVVNKDGSIEVKADRSASVAKDAVRVFLAENEVLPLIARPVTEESAATLLPQVVDFDTFNMLRGGE